jgi:hypothetical protein
MGRSLVARIIYVRAVFVSKSAANRHGTPVLT